MLKIKRTSEFKKQYKKLKRSGIFSQELDFELRKIILQLANSQKLDKKYLDHALKGYKLSTREFHLRSDILIVYKIERKQVLLTLINIGSHSNLFK